MLARKGNEPCPQEIIRNVRMSFGDLTVHEIGKFKKNLCRSQKRQRALHLLGVKQTMKSKGVPDGHKVFAKLPRSQCKSGSLNTNPSVH